LQPNALGPAGYDQGLERPFIVVPGSLASDLVRHRIRPVAHPREGLREGKGGAFGVGEVGSLPPTRLPRSKRRSSVSPAFLATRGCMSTQALHPVILLVRRLTSSSVRSGTPLFPVDAARAFMASGTIIAGWLGLGALTRFCTCKAVRASDEPPASL
jgi:hypothetical protein